MRDVNLIFYILAFFAAMTATALTENRLIPILKKRAEQPLYAEGPTWHLQKKGTPTMGGLGFLITMPIILLGAAAFLFLNGNAYFAKSLLITITYAISNGLIGMIDDTAKIRKKENLGLTALQKLCLQAITATLFLLARHIFLYDRFTDLSLP